MPRVGVEWGGQKGSAESKAPLQALLGIVNTQTTVGGSQQTEGLNSCAWATIHQLFHFCRNIYLQWIKWHLSRKNGRFTLWNHRKITGSITPTENLVPKNASKHTRKDVVPSARNSIGNWGYRHLQSEQKALCSHPEKALLTRQCLPAYNTFIPSLGRYFQCKVTDVVGLFF